ncbi:hypothetical protein PGB90_006316 [Kerria lacca]
MNVPPSSMNETQKPHKRTGVWTTETVKQKSSTDNIFKRFSRKDITAINNVGEDDHSITQTNFNNFDDFGETRVEAHLLKLPELSRWTDVNISVLLNQFSDESKVKENNNTWLKDSLFTEITNELNK